MKAAVATVLALAFCASSAAAAPVDVSSAHAGLRAYRAYLATSLARVDAARESDRQFIASIAAKCPTALSRVNTLPEDQFDQAALVQFGKEAAADLVVSVLVPYRSPRDTLDNRVSRLRWSNPGLARAVHRALRRQRAFFQLPPSDLCADAAAQAAHPLAVPLGTRKYLRTFQRDARLSALADLTRAIRRFRPPSDARLAREVARLETRLDDRLTKLVDANERKLLRVLDLRI